MPVESGLRSRGQPGPELLMSSIAEQVAWQLVGETAVIVDVASGTSLGLNETGTFIWTRLHESDEQIARDLAEKFQIPYPDALRDVVEFVDSLRQRHLLS